METLFEQLQEEEKLGRVNRFVHPEIDELIGFNYTEETKFRKEWNEINRQARGIIFYKGELIGKPFSMFPNIEELGVENLYKKKIDYITSKEDGSLIIAFWLEDLDKWILCTRGSFKSPQAEAATVIWKSIKAIKLDKKTTWLFEYVGPSNKNVCRTKYPKDKLILLGAIVTDLNIEYHEKYLDQIAKAHKFGRPSYFQPDNKLYRMIKDNNDPNFEGVVARFTDGTRAKIKSKLYIKLHRVLTGEFTSKRILDIWLESKKDGDLSKLITDIPDEFFTELNEELKKVNIRWLNCSTDIYNQYNRMKLDKDHKKSTRKDLALSFSNYTFLLPLLFSENTITYKEIDETILKTFIRKELKD